MNLPIASPLGEPACQSGALATDEYLLLVNALLGCFEADESVARKGSIVQEPFADPYSTHARLVAELGQCAGGSVEWLVPVALLFELAASAVAEPEGAPSPFIRGSRATDMYTDHLRSYAEQLQRCSPQAFGTACKLALAVGRQDAGGLMPVQQGGIHRLASGDRHLIERHLELGRLGANAALAVLAANESDRWIDADSCIRFGECLSAIHFLRVVSSRVVGTRLDLGRAYGDGIPPVVAECSRIKTEIEARRIVCARAICAISPDGDRQRGLASLLESVSEAALRQLRALCVRADTSGSGRQASLFREVA